MQLQFSRQITPISLIYISRNFVEKVKNTTVFSQITRISQKENLKNSHQKEPKKATQLALIIYESLNLEHKFVLFQVNFVELWHLTSLNLALLGNNSANR